MPKELKDNKQRYIDIIDKSFKSNFRNYKDVINAIAKNIRFKEIYTDFTSIKYLEKEGIVTETNWDIDIPERKICTEN